MFGFYVILTIVVLFIAFMGGVIGCNYSSEYMVVIGNKFDRKK